MDSWMLLKEKGESSFKLKDYETACSYYKDALADVENKFDESKPDLKIEASKISSNVSLMCFKLSKELNNESFLNESKSYAKTTIKYNPKWVKGYLRLVDTCGELKNMDDALDAISLYLQNNKDEIINNDFISLLTKIKYYTHVKIMMLSPSWHLIKYPNNVCVIDPLGAGHFKDFQEFLYHYGTSVKEISVLIRPGIYIGCYLLTNADIDIVGDCKVEINDTTKAIDKDPVVIFKNTDKVMSFGMWAEQEENIDNSSTFYFKDSKISMKRVSVFDQIMHYPIHSIIADCSNIKMFESSFCSLLSSGIESYNSKLHCKSCRSIGSSQGVSAKSMVKVKLSKCFISQIKGTGVSVKNDTEIVVLKSCTISKCEQQGLVIFNSSKDIKVLDSHFEENCSLMTVHEGSLQLCYCRSLIRNTVIKNQKSTGIVIEGGSHYFDNVSVENCVIGFCVAGKAEIVNTKILSCSYMAITISEHFKGPVKLENITIKKCREQIVRSNSSPMPIFKGGKNHKIRTIDLTPDLCKTLAKMRKDFREENASDIDVNGSILDKDGKSIIRSVPDSADTCEFCCISEFQLERKMKACSKCKAAFYCSPDCQQKGWKQHRATCNLISKKKQDRRNSSNHLSSMHTDENVECGSNHCELVEDHIPEDDVLATDVTQINDNEKKMGESNQREWKNKNKKKKKKSKVTF